MDQITKVSINHKNQDSMSSNEEKTNERLLEKIIDEKQDFEIKNPNKA